MDCKNNQNVGKQLQDKTKWEPIHVDEWDRDACRRILEDTKEELYHLYNAYHKWLGAHRHSLIEKEEQLKTLKRDIAKLYMATKRKLYEVLTRSEVELGKRKIMDATTKVLDTLCEGIYEIKKHEVVQTLSNCMQETLVSVKNDERIKQHVKKLKKGTIKVAESAVHELKRVLDTDDEKQR